MKINKRMGRSTSERYKELAAGLFIAFISQLLQLLQSIGIVQLPGLSSLLGIVPVAIIVGLVAPAVDDLAAFAFGYAVLAIAFLLTGLTSAGGFAFNMLFALAALFVSYNLKKNPRRRVEPTAYMIATGIVAVILAVAFIGLSGTRPIAIISTSTTISTTTSVVTTSTSTTSTTTILTYSGCSTIERDQPFKCRDPVLIPPHNLSFTLSSNDTSDTLYNLDLACTNTFSLAAPPKSQFYYLQTNGTFSQGLPGTSITASAPIRATGLPCFGVNNSTKPFNGILWVAYHPGSQATPLQTTHIQVYYNMTSVPALTHVNNTASETG